MTAAMTETEPRTTAQERRAAVIPPTRSRRRPVLVALGIALVLLGGIAVFYVTTNLTRTVSVLATSTDIARGQTITADDLTTIQLAGGQSLNTVAATKASQVVGGIALVDLPADSLITSSNVGDGLTIPSGDSIVGITLTRAQLPAFPLAAGDSVRVVETPVAQGDPPAATPASYPATVFTSRYDSEAQVWIVDVVVPKQRAVDIAARAATGRVALVVDATAGE